MQNESEVTMLLIFFKKNPKVIDLILLDALTYMFSALGRYADEYNAAASGAETSYFATDSAASVSELVLYPLVCPINARLIASLKDATQVKGSDSLLALVEGGAPVRTLAVARKRGRARGGSCSGRTSLPAYTIQHEQKTQTPPVTLLQILSDKFKRKYFTILTKYFSLCHKQSFNIFRAFRDEFNYQGAIQEFNQQQQQWSVHSDHKKKSRRRHEKNAFIVEDEAYSDLDGDDEHSSCSNEEDPVSEEDDGDIPSATISPSKATCCAQLSVSFF